MGPTPRPERAAARPAQSPEKKAPMPRKEAQAGNGIFSPEACADLTDRLKRIEGQVRGVQRMVDEGRDCRAILNQLTAVRSAAYQVSLLLVRDYATQCLRDSKSQRRSTSSSTCWVTCRTEPVKRYSVIGRGAYQCAPFCVGHSRRLKSRLGSLRLPDRLSGKITGAGRGRRLRPRRWTLG
jgi:CsoR family transcriptional regulator, copper-sensing transcriptional repressor